MNIKHSIYSVMQRIEPSPFVAPKHTAREIMDMQSRIWFDLMGDIFPKEEALIEEAVLTAKIIDYQTDIIVDEAIQHYETRMDKTKPLHLLLGEDHYIGAHLLAETMIALKIKARGYNIAVGLEHDPNDFSKTFYDWSKKQGIELDKNKTSILLRQHQNTLTPAEIIMAGKWHIANKTQAFLLHNQGITTRFNDAAYTSDWYLDMSDNVTRETAEKIFTGRKPPENWGQIWVGGEDGMDIRNEVLRANAVQDAKETVAQIYIEIYGVAHLVGDAFETDCPFNKSRFYKGLQPEANDNMYAVPLLRNAFDYSIPPEADNHKNLNKSCAIDARRLNRGIAEDEKQMTAIMLDHLHVSDGLVPDNSFERMVRAEKSAQDKKKSLFEDIALRAG